MGLRGPKPGAQVRRSADGSRLSVRSLIRTVTYPALDTLPPPPDWLPNGAAVHEWNRLGNILLAAGILNDGSITPLGNLCALHGKLVQLWSAGEMPKAALLAQYRILCDGFALHPMNNGKVRLQAEDVKKHMQQNEEHATKAEDGAKENIFLKHRR
jgi:hypothetical protein